MDYEIIDEESKQQWIDWLEEKKKDLDGKKQENVTRDLLNTEEGDLALMKDVVGIALAALTGKKVTIF